MGVLFTLTPAIKSIAQQAFDDLLTEVGRDCLLIYPGIMIPCDCTGATWHTGGPASINGICPLCNGSNLREEITTETIRMGVVNDPARFWNKLPRTVQIAAGTIQTKCYAADVIKIRQAKEMQVNPSVDNLTRNRYILISEPEDVSSIIQNRYWIAMWGRVQ